MNKILFITELVYQIICSVASQCSVETGGVLVGILGDPLVIVGAGQPGEKAIHHSVRFTTDPTEDTECLSKWRQKYGPVIEILGWFHKHKGLQEPSGGDRDQVLQLAGDFNDNRPILVGIYCENGLFRKTNTLRFFSLDDNNKQIEYQWEIIPNDSPKIQVAIDSVPHKPQIKETEFWNDPEFQFYTNPIGRQRILEDMQELKRFGWHTSIGRSKNNNCLILEVKNYRSDIKLLMPPEYPLNAPIVLTGDGKRVRQIRSITEWNSTTTLKEIVAEVSQILDCPFCNARHLETI